MIRLVITGLPASQGSKTRMPNGAMVDGNSAKARANLAAWRQAVRAECRRWLEANPREPLTEPCELVLSFRFPQVASDPYRFHHATTPDLDKCYRATADALVQGGLLADDRYICTATVDKTYCMAGQPAGCSIEIHPMGRVERLRREGLKAAAAERRKLERTSS